MVKKLLKTKYKPIKPLGIKLFQLAEEDYVPSKIKFLVEKEKVLEISTEASRYFLYPTKYRLLIDPIINEKSYPYAIFNTKSTWRGAETIKPNPQSLLKGVYEHINKNLRSYYANQVKIIKPGTYLFHNLTDGERHKEKAYVNVYTSIQGKLMEFVSGSVVRHEGELKEKGSFELVIETVEKEFIRVPAHALELLIFEKAPVFKETPEGKMGQLAVEMLRRGHICRPEPAAGYILDCCDVPRLIFVRLVGNQFEIPKELIPTNKHDNEVKELIEKYGQ